MNKRQVIHHSSVGKHPDHQSHPALVAGRTAHAEEPSDDIAGGFSRILCKLFLPLAVTAVSGAVFVTALTIPAYQSQNPTALVTPLSMAALGVASLAGGITAGKCGRERAVPGSLVSGCLFAGILCLIALFGSGEMQGIPTSVAWMIRLAAIPVHMIGGFMVRPRKKPTTHTAGKHASHRH